MKIMNCPLWPIKMINKQKVALIPLGKSLFLNKSVVDIFSVATLNGMLMHALHVKG
jgi:hypothetical protein